MPMRLRVSSAAFAAWTSAILATRNALVSAFEKCASIMAGLPWLQCPAREADRDPVMRRRQAHAAEGWRTCSGDGGGDRMKTTRFDAADYLDTAERQTAYIAAALESGDANFVRDALCLVAQTHNKNEVARKAGLNRESLYKALGDAGNPEFGTVMRDVTALGLTLSAHAAADVSGSKRRRSALAV